MNIQKDNKSQRARKLLLNILVNFIMLFLSLLCAVGFQNMKYSLRKNGSNAWVFNQLPIFLNILQIWIFNWLNRLYNKHTTRWENHKYYSTYEDSFILKTFIFTFGNFILSFSIIAFFKGSLDQKGSRRFRGDGFLAICHNSDTEQGSLTCYDELSMQYRIYFIVYILVNCLDAVTQGTYQFFRSLLNLRKKPEERKYPFG